MRRHETPTQDQKTETKLVLVESNDEWVLTRAFDPRLEVGTVFQLLGNLWHVTWESRKGFGGGSVH